MRIHLFLVGKMHFQAVHFRCIPVHFPHQPQLNAHVQPLETKMAVGRENDEYSIV
jgi:hypothetical protein